jgi:type IV secretory pathway VirB10-like protein
MDTDDLMSPDASPGGVAAKSGVRRVNNLPVYIVGSLIGGFVLIMAMVAYDRADRQHRPSPDAEARKAAGTSSFAMEIAGSQKDGFIQPAKAAPQTVAIELPQPRTDAVLIARPDDLERPPLPPPGVPGQGDTRRIEELERLRMAKLQQLEEAVKAKTSVQVNAPRSAGSAPDAVPGATAPPSRDDALAPLAAIRRQIDAQTSDDPTTAYQARLQQIRAGAPASGATHGPPVAPGGGKIYSQFEGSGQSDRWRLDAAPQAPRSPYELRAGFIVPAMLISGINSELPGQIVAQVSQDVFDTATGKWRLIPQGARLVGSYSSDVAFGQSRVMVAWQRIVFPDGKAMDIGAMPGADSAGYAGYKDQVNNHYLRLFGSAFLMSAVTAGIAISQPETLDIRTRQSTSGAISEALGQQLGQVTAQLIAKNLNIAPTLQIRPGYRFNVIVTKDMTFSKPYQAFDY